jgi:hypothetical protein
LDWLQAASAAFKAQDYYSAVYLSEAWLELVTQTDFSDAWLVPLPPDKEKRRHACRQLLAAAALKLRERDLPYAFSDPLDPAARNDLYRHEGSFFDRLADFDALASRNHSQREGIATSLYALHLHATARLVDTGAAECVDVLTAQSEELRTMQTEAAWRLTAWDVPDDSSMLGFNPSGDASLGVGLDQRDALVGTTVRTGPLEAALPVCLDILCGRRAAPLAPLLQAMTSAEIERMNSENSLENMEGTHDRLRPAFRLYILQELADAWQMNLCVKGEGSAVATTKVARHVNIWMATPLPDDFDAADYLLSIRSSILRGLACTLGARESEVDDFPTLGHQKRCGHFPLIFSTATHFNSSQRFLPH